MALKLSVIIVNYKSAKLIADCLDSAFLFPSANEFEWIIVNNDPDTDDEPLITQKYPFVKWINMGYNAGFARANNAGIKASACDVVLLLNPDTIIPDDAINKCYQKFVGRDDAACSVQLLNEDHSPQITGSYFMTGGLNHLLPLPYLGIVLQKITSPFRKKRTAIIKATAEQEVDRINGAFMMVKKQAIDKAGLFDEDFFLYSEEVEWCSRLRKVGPIVVYGGLFVVHLQGTSINKETEAADKSYFDLYDKKGLQLIISRNMRIRKQFGVGWFVFHLFANTIEIPVYFICSFFQRLFTLKNPFADFRKISGYAYNVMRLWGLTPTIIANKPHFYKMF
jgi:GT2 family glycosyltransferase